MSSMGVMVSACAQADGRSPAYAAGGPTNPSPVEVTKLLVFVVENHSLDQMRRDMPETLRFAKQYGYATNYRAIAHPSLPNYLAVTGGSTSELRPTEIRAPMVSWTLSLRPGDQEGEDRPNVF